MPLRLSDRRVLALAGALFSVAGPAAAQGAPPLSVALDYHADPALTDCPSAAELSAAVAKQLGFDPFGAGQDAKRRRVKASIERTPRGTEAHFEWLSETGQSEGERRLTSESQDCAEVARGLTFAIAVQIQLRASAEAAPPAAPPAAEAPKPPPKPALPPARKPSRPTIMVGAGLLVQRGLTPGTSPGLRVFGSLGGQRAAIEVSTEATLPAEQTYTDKTGFSARELSGRLAPCLRFTIAGLCAVGMVGQLHVRGAGVDQVQSPSTLIAGVGARLQLLWPALPTFGALLQAEVLVLATPRTVQLNRADVWSTAPVVLGASLDLAAIFR